MDVKYFVITDKNDFKGFILHDGLNIMKYYEHDIGNVSFHGFCFKTINHVTKDYSNGFYIREVTLPKNDDELIFVPKYDSFYSMHANKVILSKRYSLFEPETYERFGLDMRQNKYLVDLASASGNIEFLNWWLSADIDLLYSAKSIDEASANGHIDVLDFWLIPRKQLKYTEYAMDRASWHGVVKVLEWWKYSGLEPKYTDSAIDNASGSGKINILEWWRDSGLKMKYTYAALIGRIEDNSKVLKWWLQSGLEIECSEQAIDLAPIHILNIWLESGIELIYSENVLDGVSMRGDLDKLEFWFRSGLELKYTSSAFDYVPSAKVLDLWEKYELEFKYTHKAMKYASHHIHIDVLDWWLRQSASGLLLKYTDKIIDNLLRNSHRKIAYVSEEDEIRVLEWWKNSGLEVKYTNVAMDTASRMGRVDILNWWLKSGLELKYSREAIVNIEHNRARVLRWWKNKARADIKDM